MFHRPPLATALLLSAACAIPSPGSSSLEVAATHGIYERGPTDPEPFLWRDDPHPSRILVSLDPLGDRLPDNGRVLAARRNEYRVLRGDGTFDLLSARQLSTQ